MAVLRQQQVSHVDVASSTNVQQLGHVKSQQWKVDLHAGVANDVLQGPSSSERHEIRCCLLSEAKADRHCWSYGALGIQSRRPVLHLSNIEPIIVLRVPEKQRAMACSSVQHAHGQPVHCTWSRVMTIAMMSSKEMNHRNTQTHTSSQS